jgi:predicted SAM-dependent methyltransferase
MRSTNPIKLHLGCGYRILPGYTNVDSIDSRADIVIDFRKLDYPKQSVDEIRSHFVFEHFSRKEAKELLKQWRQWLKIGGLLVVETPDFEGICENFYKDPYWMTRHCFGSQEDEWSFHKDGWYEAKFRELLPAIGYEIISIDRRVGRKGVLPNILVKAKRV